MTTPANGLFRKEFGMIQKTEHSGASSSSAGMELITYVEVQQIHDAPQNTKYEEPQTLQHSLHTSIPITRKSWDGRSTTVQSLYNAIIFSASQQFQATNASAQISERRRQRTWRGPLVPQGEFSPSFQTESPRSSCVEYRVFRTE